MILFATHYLPSKRNFIHYVHYIISRMCIVYDITSSNASSESTMVNNIIIFLE